jgi:hypothetical protein
LPALDVAATGDPASGHVHVSIVNRSQSDDALVAIHGLAGDWGRSLLWHEDPGAGNTIELPTAVAPVFDTVSLDAPLLVPAHAHVTLYPIAASG